MILDDSSFGFGLLTCGACALRRLVFLAIGGLAF